MYEIEQIYKKYPDFKFWSIKKRPIIIYFIVYYAINITIIYLFKNVNAPFLFFLFWAGIIIFGALTNFSKGLSTYLHKYNEDFRRYLFYDKIYGENAMPVIGTFGMMRFIFRSNNFQLDQVKKNLKNNLLIFDICTIIVFFSGIILMQIYP